MQVAQHRLPVRALRRGIRRRVDEAERERREVPRDREAEGGEGRRERAPVPQRQREHGERDRDEAKARDVLAHRGGNGERREARDHVRQEHVAEHARALDVPAERESECAEAEARR